MELAKETCVIMSTKVTYEINTVSLLKIQQHQVH